LQAGELTLENSDAHDPVGAFTLREGASELDVPRPRFAAPDGADPRVAPFAAHASALLASDERPTFTDGLQAQRLLDEVRRTAS
jgi:hypothetical protein